MLYKVYLWPVADPEHNFFVGRGGMPKTDDSFLMLIHTLKIAVLNAPSQSELSFLCEYKYISDRPELEKQNVEDVGLHTAKIAHILQTYKFFRLLCVLAGKNNGN